MRGRIAACLAVLALCAPSAAFALTADDTMAAWVLATDAERAALLNELEPRLPAGHVGRSALLACVNRAAEVGGHSALPVGEIVQACASPAPGGGDQDSTGI